MLYGTKLEPTGLIPFREIKLSPLKTRLLDVKARAVRIAALPLLMGSYSCIGMSDFAGRRIKTVASVGQAYFQHVVGEVSTVLI
jgi:hypothetical protein